MQRKQPASYVAGAIAAFCYVSLALLAFSRYPGAYSPLHNWLSDLGSGEANPGGALFYNLAVISAGVALMAFFLGLSRWRMERPTVQRAMLLTTQSFGLLGSAAMVMSALYPINHLELHRFWSISLYALLGTAFAFSISALRYHPQCPRWVLAVGVITAFVDILSAVLRTVYVLEWITVALFLAYVLIVGVMTRAMQGADARRSVP